MQIAQVAYANAIIKDRVGCTLCAGGAIFKFMVIRIQVSYS